MGDICTKLSSLYDALTNVTPSWTPQTRVVPPWVEEHPDVFNDPNFSLTQPDSLSSHLIDTADSAMEVSINPATRLEVRES